MSKRNIYGTPALTLSEAVEQMMIMQNNDRQSHFMSYLVHAKWSWKSLLWNSIWAVRQMVVDVDATTKTLKIPQGTVRLVGLSVVDTCGNLQPLGFNPNLNTVKLEAHAKTCSCATCAGEDTLCAVLDDIQLRTEIIVINAEDYQKRTWNRLDAGGDLMEVEEVPTWDAALERIVYVTNVRSVCKLEVSDAGCILATEPNRRSLLDCCGCFMLSCHQWLYNWHDRPQVDMTPYRGFYGQWKWNAKAGDVIDLKHVQAKQIIITYQADGECDTAEMLVPEYALDALWNAMIYRQIKFNPTSSRSDKDGAFGDAEREKTRLRKFLNPIRMSQFLRLQGTIPKW